MDEVRFEQAVALVDMRQMPNARSVAERKAGWQRQAGTKITNAFEIRSGIRGGGK